jgi:hypothetical protein
VQPVLGYEEAKELLSASLPEAIDGPLIALSATAPVKSWP